VPTCGNSCFLAPRVPEMLHTWWVAVACVGWALGMQIWLRCLLTQACGAHAPSPRQTRVLISCTFEESQSVICKSVSAHSPHWCVESELACVMHKRTAGQTRGKSHRLPSDSVLRVHSTFAAWVLTSVSWTRKLRLNKLRRSGGSGRRTVSLRPKPNF
jgi:hypothetical protein